MYGYFKKTILFLTYILLCTGFLFCSELSPDTSRHEQIYLRLSQDGFFPAKQPLENSKSLVFPYNVTVYSDNPESTISFIMDDEFAYGHIRLVEALSQYADVAVTVNNQSHLPEDEQIDMPAGVRTYISSFTFPENHTVIILNSDPSLSGDECTIIPGANGKLTPYCLFRNLTEVFDETGIPYSFGGKALTLFRLNVTDYSDTLAVCLDAGCKAIQINFSPSINTGLLDQAAEQLLERSLTWEEDDNINYTYIKTHFGTFFITEKNHLVILVTLTGITLFFLCGLSFSFGKKKEENRKDFIKYWSLIPISGVILLMLVYCAQYTVLFTATFLSAWPFWQFLYKIVLTCCYFLIFALLRHVFRLPTADFLYGYCLTLSCFINIYIFSIIDLPLLIPCTISWIIAYISRTCRKTITLIGFTILLAITYSIQVFYSMKELTAASFSAMSDGSLKVNIMIAFFLLPFVFIGARIAISTGIPGSFKRRNRRILIESSVIVGLTVVLVLSMATADVFMNTRVQPPAQTVVETAGHADVRLETEFRSDRTDFTLVFSSSMKVLKYEVSAVSSYSMPIIYADFPYEYSTVDDSIIFRLDENPPAPFLLSGCAEAGCPMTFYIKVYMYDGNTVFLENLSVTMPSSSRK